ncbi:MAG: TVP38/TMEM64 family protein [Clostridium sp.]|nr:TVP38/TMEM64 family protein [Clostridium sp.]
MDIKEEYENNHREVNFEAKKKETELLKKKNKSVLIKENIFKYLPFILMGVFVFIAALNRDKITVENILEFAPKNLFLASLIILLFYAIKSLSVIFPIAVLYIVSGKLFNVAFAILLNVVGLIISLSLPYIIGKVSGEDLVLKIKSKYPKTNKIDEFKNQNNWVFVFIFRIVRLIPGDLGSILLGAINTKYIPYILVSLLIRLPSMITMTIFGNNIDNPGSPKFILSLLIRVLFFILSFVIVYIINKERGAKIELDTKNKEA